MGMYLPSWLSLPAMTSTNCRLLIQGLNFLRSVRHTECGKLHVTPGGAHQWCTSMLQHHEDFILTFQIQRKEEGSVPCPGQPELAYKGKSSALVTGFVLAEGTHQTRYLFGELHSI